MEFSFYKMIDTSWSGGKEVIEVKSRFIAEFSWRDTEESRKSKGIR
jgi:hypothetical protein